MEVWRNQLLGKATVLTPNLPELATITNRAITSEQEAIEAGKSLLAEFPTLRSVIITGGHLHEDADQVEDFLICKDKKGISIHRTKHPRISTRNSHGTGCTFASAFSAFHLLEGDDYNAFKKAMEYMDALIQKSSTISIGKGKGPLSHHLVTTKSN
jgi:hydroxymethylpyrimidine kinase/phosphomethylpyrimidine kinase